MQPPCAKPKKLDLNMPLDVDLETPLPGFNSISEALADLAAGKPVVVLDDEHRENEGDLIINADKVTTESIAFMVEHTTGVICISMEGKDLDRLKLPLMVNSVENEEAMTTAFTVTVDLKAGTSTGISASDRAKTLRRLADPTAAPQEFNRPGHIFPLRYRAGGVLVRPGHTEAGVDLARLSGSYPAGALCEIVDKRDGNMARTPQLMAFAQQHGLKCIAIADLIRYRLRHDQLLAPLTAAPATVQTRHGGPVEVHAFRSAVDGAEHLAFAHGPISGSPSSSSQQQQQHGVLVHIVRESQVADLLGCPRSTLDASVRSVVASGAGVVLYLRSAPSGAPSVAEELQRLGAPAAATASNGNGGGAGDSTADLQAYALCAQMLRRLGVGSVRLAARSSDEATALRSCGVDVAEVVPLPLQPLPLQPQVNGYHHGANGGNGAVALQLNGSAAQLTGAR